MQCCCTAERARRTNGGHARASGTPAAALPHAVPGGAGPPAGLATTHIFSTRYHCDALNEALFYALKDGDGRSVTVAGSGLVGQAWHDAAMRAERGACGQR